MTAALTQFRGAMADMRAVVVAEGGGGPEVLSVGTVPRPVPTDGQVLVAVKATALNRADTLQRKGGKGSPRGIRFLLTRSVPTATRSLRNNWAGVCGNNRFRRAWSYRLEGRR